MDAPGLTAEDKHALVARILASPQFAKAPQLKRFLQFIVEGAGTAEANVINETEIGRHVLRRGQSDFDPNTDNIVRVQARHLRKKLEEYFSAEGREEAVLLTIPKGSYVPRFEFRAGLAAATPDMGAEPNRPSSRPRIAMMTVAVVSAVLGAVALWVVQHAGSPTVASNAASAADAGTDALWATIGRTGRKTFIVLSDTSLSTLQTLARRQVPLAQYLAPNYPGEAASGFGDRHSRAILSEISKYRYTGLNSAIVASKLYFSGRKRGIEAALSFPRDINLREFKSENFFLIGSRFSVPWVELLEGQLNFTFDGNPQDLQFFIRNKAPRPGEQAIYRPGLSADKQPTDYAAIALLPNLNRTGMIVCLQGVTGMSNEAAEEIISNRENSPLHKILRTLPHGTLPRLEILIRATGMSGAPAGVQVVATRVGAG